MTEGGDLVVGHAAETGVGQGHTAEIVVMTAREGEVQRRANLAVNLDPRVKAGLNLAADPEVGHPMKT